MSDSEAGEVTSSTDVKTTRRRVLSSQDPMPDSIHISSSERIIDSTNVSDGHHDDIDHITFSTDQQEAMPGVLETLGSGSNEDGYAIINADQALGQHGHVILAGDGQGVTLADTTTLQSLFANQGNTSHVTTPTGETIQIITVSNAAQLAGMGNNKLWQLMPTLNSSEIGTIIINQPPESQDTGDSCLETIETSEAASSSTATTTQVVDMVPVSSLPGSIAEMLMSPPQAPQNLPPGCPQWAARLRDCEKIGDAFRGWVESEVELDLLLTYHKQQTQSFWGTRQSPSPAKQSTRLMWKSQYVPFDGIPFVNAGSRAVVMECQFGPRRKGAQAKRITQEVIRGGEFRQTCPARIYIKKVRKFPDCAVDITVDKKSMKAAMDKSFHVLKERGIETFGHERYYVQLPTEASHEFHGDLAETVEEAPSRLHPRVSQKIRDMVAAGEHRLYAVRKALRKFVERELFDCPESVPEKHNLTFYPTVNDLQNHIHQALRDIEAGLLPVTAPQVVEVDMLGEGGQEMKWQTTTMDSTSPQAETVTVTLTQHPAEDGQHVISRVETHLSDGSTRVSTSLTPETAQLLAKLHPNMFPSGSILQLHDGQKHIQPIVIGGGKDGDNTQALKLVAQHTAGEVGMEEEEDDSSPDHTSLTQDSSQDSMETSQVTTLEIVHGDANDGSSGDLNPSLQSVHLMDSQQGMIIQDSGGTGLPAGLQFISTDTELTDSEGRPLQILSSVDGQGISFIQPSDHDVTNAMGDVTGSVDEEGVITIAMTPSEAHLIKSEDMADAMVSEPLD